MNKVIGNVVFFGILLIIGFFLYKKSNFKKTLFGFMLMIILSLILIIIGNLSFFLLFFDFLSQVTGIKTFDGLMIPFLIFVPPFVYIFLFNRLVDDIGRNDIKGLFSFNTIMLFISVLTFSLFIYGEGKIFEIYNFKFQLYHFMVLIISIIGSYLLSIFHNKLLLLQKITKKKFIFFLIIIFILLLKIGNNIDFSNEGKQYYIPLGYGMILSIIFNYIEIFYLYLIKKIES